MDNSLLVWIDLEMTGLNPDRDVILEIACVITDGQLRVVAEGPSVVIHQPDAALAVMSPMVRGLHTASGLLTLIAQSDISVADAQQQLVDFIATHCKTNQGRLAGNSIWKDRMFLSAYMPRILVPLHYRIIDVSTIKELVLQWYPGVAKFEKQNKHRAIDDVYESIAELRYYREHYFV
jgi:oligoribonuclease